MSEFQSKVVENDNLDEKEEKLCPLCLGDCQNPIKYVNFGKIPKYPPRDCPLCCGFGSEKLYREFLARQANT